MFTGFLVIALLYCLITHSYGWAFVWGVILVIRLLTKGGSPSTQAPPARRTPRPAEPPKRTPGEPCQPLDMPVNPPVDDSYGITDKGLYWKLENCKAHVVGKPGSGLNQSDFGAGRVKAGQLGEKSIAKALIHSGVLDDPDACVWFSMRNPADETGRSDIDIAVAKGRMLWLIDAKRYSVPAPGMWLGPAQDTSEFEWQVMICNRMPEDTKDSRAQTDFVHASSNMRWALGEVRKEFPSMDVFAVIALTRSKGGVFGTTEQTFWPGSIRVRNVDNFIEQQLLPGLASADGPVPADVVRRVDRLVKNV